MKRTFSERLASIIILGKLMCILANLLNIPSYKFWYVLLIALTSDFLYVFIHKNYFYSWYFLKKLISIFLRSFTVFKTKSAPVSLSFDSYAIRSFILDSKWR